MRGTSSWEGRPTPWVVPLGSPSARARSTRMLHSVPLLSPMTVMQRIGCLLLQHMGIAIFFYPPHALCPAIVLYSRSKPERPSFQFSPLFLHLYPPQVRAVLDSKQRGRSSEGSKVSLIALNCTAAPADMMRILADQ